MNDKEIKAVFRPWNIQVVHSSGISRYKLPEKKLRALINKYLPVKVGRMLCLTFDEATTHTLIETVSGRREKHQFSQEMLEEFRTYQLPCVDATDRIEYARQRFQEIGAQHQFPKANGRG